MVARHDLASYASRKRDWSHPMNPPQKDRMKDLFDTSNPDNNLGPLLVAVLIAIVAAVVFGVFGASSHDWRL